ncbi:hypothetical protein PMAYCL1PPCAC_21615, partial [Pristionchus mayeri]
RKIQLQSSNDQLELHNENNRKKSAPILVWIVRGDASNLDIAEVYDAYGSIRDSAPAGVITIMAPEPFYVSMLTYGAALPLQAITAGFDAFGEEDKCTRVVQEDPARYQDLDADVRSPLITLSFGSGDTQVMLTAFKNKDPSLDLGKSLFVTSPGYVGCTVK